MPRVDPMKAYAVLTGDFIGFSGLPADLRRNMYFVLQEGSSRVSRAWPGIMPWPVDMFRGDGWQLLLADPAASLRAGILLRGHIRAECGKGVDTRMAIAVGSIDYVPDGRVSAGDGEAFRLSGKLLGDMGASGAGSIRFHMKDHPVSGCLDALVRLVGDLAGQWTPGQARAMTGALQGWSHSRISRLWSKPISPQAVGTHLARAGWPGVRHALEAFEHALEAGWESGKDDSARP